MPWRNPPFANIFSRRIRIHAIIRRNGNQLSVFHFALDDTACIPTSVLGTAGILVLCPLVNAGKSFERLFLRHSSSSLVPFCGHLKARLLRIVQTRKGFIYLMFENNVYLQVLIVEKCKVQQHYRNHHSSATNLLYCRHRQNFDALTENRSLLKGFVLLPTRGAHEGTQLY